MRYLKLIGKNGWLLLILFFSAVLRFYKLDYQSPWMDELHTLIEANPSFSFQEVYLRIRTSEQMPPLYFYLVWLLFKVFGYHTLTLRMLSAVGGVAGVYAIYRFGKEIRNKPTGLIMAALLAFNYFNLYYSQDGRPYILLQLCCILSFWQMFRFLNVPTWKRAFLFGICSGLMALFHFFGLFVVVAQGLTLLLLLWSRPRGLRLRQLYLSGAWGLTVILLFLPALPLFLGVAHITSFWIPAPTPDSYEKIFGEFFNSSEILLWLVAFFILLYLLQLVKIRDSRFSYDAIVADRNLSSFLVLSVWIITVLWIPLVRSYLSAPMLISRYFIVLLPAVILIMGLGLESVRNRLIRNVLLVTFLFFSVTDIFVVRHYFSQPNKTQFREAADYVVRNNTAKETLYTSLSWYYNHFMDPAGIKTEEKDFKNVVGMMLQDSTKIKSFWYADACGRHYDLSPEEQQFLDSRFILESGFDGFDAWARHYVPSQGSIPIDLKDFSPIKPTNEGLLDFYGNQESSVKIRLKPGEYTLSVLGQSFPAETFGGENAHIWVKVDGTEKGNFYLDTSATNHSVNFSHSGDEVTITLGFDNDFTQGEKDRNARILQLRILPR